MQDPTYVPWLILANLPALLIYLGGIIYTLLFWRHSPKACGFAVSGLGLLMVLSLTSATYQAWLMAGFGTELDNFRTIIQFYGIVTTSLHLLAIVLLLIAVHVDRRAGPANPAAQSNA